MNEPPGARARIALTGLTIAEHFRDQGKDILFFVDNVFRFTQAGSEVSALLGRIPSAVGYQPTLATVMGAMQERITSTTKGSITSVQAIYVPDDDLTGPRAGDHVLAPRRHDRSLAPDRRARHLPSRRSARLNLTHPRSARRRRAPLQRRAAGDQSILQRYKDLQDIIAILGMLCPALYFVVLGFNLTVTFALREWWLGACGVLITLLVAALTVRAHSGVEALGVTPRGEGVVS